MVDTNPTTSAITLKVSDLNDQLIVSWVKTADSITHCLQETHTEYEDNQMKENPHVNSS